MAKHGNHGRGIQGRNGKSIRVEVPLPTPRVPPVGSGSISRSRPARKDRNLSLRKHRIGEIPGHGRIDQRTP